MSRKESEHFTHAIRLATGKTFCQYCRVSKPTDEFARIRPRACCLKCVNRGSKK